MANVYKSRYTGEQIEQLLYKANDIQTVTPFPDPQDEDYLGAIEIDNRPYLIPKGTKVEANVGGVEGAYILTITIGEQKYVMPAYVSPNPAESGTIELNKLAIGSTIYTIPKGTVVKANDGGVEGAYLQTLTIGNDKFVMPSYVFPNPAAEATTNLNKLGIGDTIYQLPHGGGANVEANPSGDATATLNKIGINNVVYGLPAGGGASGGGYDLIINAETYYPITLSAHKVDGTFVRSTTYTQRTVLSNITDFNIALNSAALYVSHALLIRHDGNIAQGEGKVIPRVTDNVYQLSNGEELLAILLGNCEIYYSGN